MTLDEAEGRIELKIGLEVLREGQLDFHSTVTSVVEDDLLSVKLFIDQNVQVVLFFFDINRHVDAGTSNSDRDGLGVVLVLKEESEFLRDISELHRDECELDFGAAVTVNLGRSLETDLSQEFVKDVCTCWHVLLLCLSCQII